VSSIRTFSAEYVNFHRGLVKEISKLPSPTLINPHFSAPGCGAVQSLKYVLKV